MSEADVEFERRLSVESVGPVMVSVIAGLAAMFAGASPTGSPFADAVMVGAGVGVATWVGAKAPWWAVALAAGVAAATSGSIAMSVIGGVAFAVALAVGATDRDRYGIARAVVLALAFNVAARSELEWFHGASAALAIGLGALVVVVGAAGRGRPARVGVVAGAAAVLVATVLSLIAVGVVGNAARPDVADAASLAREGVDLLDAGDYSAAADRFDAAAQRFAAVDERLNGPLARPARFVPVVAQNLEAGRSLSSEAGDALSVVATALREVDPSRLSLAGGRIDIGAVRDAGDALIEVDEAFVRLRAEIDGVRSPWLVPALVDELDELDADFDEQEPRLRNAVDAVEIAPAVLGDGGVRRYLVLFTTPAEARGLGGFVGNFAEIEIRDGQIVVGDFARRSDLEDFVAANDVRCSGCPGEFLDTYGQYGFTTGPNGGVADRAWSNITMPAHFPHVAATAAALYPDSGGQEIDGVIVMDPYVVQALMAYTGPVELPQFDTVVEPESAAQFILRDQYVLAAGADELEPEDNAERVDALETLGTEVIARLLTGALPEPVELADALAPLVAERRLLVWTDRPDEQDVLDRIGLLGSLPDLGSAGGFSVAVTNGSESKIDAFLTRSSDTRLVEHPDGTRSLEATVTLTNTAPADGLPFFVIGNEVGLPVGWSRLLVAFYGPPSLDRVVLDGEPVEVSSHREAGWGRYATTVDLPPGGSVAFDVRFDVTNEVATDGAPDADPVRFEQPLAIRN